MPEHDHADQDSVTEWIAEVQAGDEAAAQRLWERYFGRLMEFCRKRLPHSTRRVGDEEDVVLNAMDSFFRGAREGRFPELGDRDELWRLLVVIASRRASNYIRDQQREKRGGGVAADKARLDQTASPAVGIEQIICREPTPEFAAMFAEEFERRLRQLDDETLRTVAQLKLEGYSNLEIADRLGSALRTVERKLALIRLTWTEGDEAFE